MEHHVSSAIRGHHVSKSFWTPAIDEVVTAIPKIVIHTIILLSALSIDPDIRSACA